MDINDLNNLNTPPPLNIACESIIAPSEEDNNSEKVRAALESTSDNNINQEITKKTEEKQNFRELLQDRVLKRLHDKAECGRKNVELTPADAPPLKSYFSNEDLWKRVEDRVAAKKANSENKIVVELPKLSNHVSNTTSSEDIKSRIRNMSKAIGLASNIQNEIKTGDKENNIPGNSLIPSHIPCAADFLGQVS